MTFAPTVERTWRGYGESGSEMRYNDGTKAALPTPALAPNPTPEVAGVG